MVKRVWPVLIAAGVCAGCGGGGQDAGKAAAPPATVAAKPAPCEGPKKWPDIRPMSAAIHSELPLGTPRDKVVQWFDKRKCKWKFGKDSNPLVPICKSEVPCTLDFKIHIDLGPDDLVAEIGIYPNTPD